GGSRFVGATHKLLTPFRGRPLWMWAVAAAGAAGLDEVMVVTGAAELAVPEGVTVVANAAWDRGQASSLRAGIDAAADAGHDAVVIGLADSPLVPPEAWRAVGAATATPIAVADYAGRRAPPVRLAKQVWPLLPTAGDAGARALLAARPDLVTAVRCTGVPGDIDTVEDLARWS
ncbi:MAG: NTP transferase domain-containing protein, partial [Acidimicrobiales bacterium]